MKREYKWFFVYDYDKEEEWLNEMAQKGYKLVDVGFCRYDFEECEPGEYIIRLEMNKPDEEYLELIEEMGAERVGHFTQWNYYARRSELGPFEIVGTIDNKIKMIERIEKLLTILCLSNISLGLNSINKANFINLLVATLLAYCLGRVSGKKDMLIRERNVVE